MLQPKPLVRGTAPPPPVAQLPHLCATGGAFPSPGGSGAAEVTLAMIHVFAAPGYAAFGAPAATGHMLPINQNQPLMAVIGTQYGGGGSTTIALPNLAGRVAIGGQAGLVSPHALQMTWLIAAEAGAAGYPAVGTMALFAGNYAPPGWLAADGSLLPIARNVPLFEAIGTAFGGNPAAFALPDLNGSAPIGTADGVSLGQPVKIPGWSDAGGLGLTWLVCVQGAFPPANGDGGFPPDQPVVGEIIAFAGATPPAGFVPADGRLLAVADYEPLFQLIGTTYGGDGQDDFALPHLRGRLAVGAG